MLTVRVADEDPELLEQVSAPAPPAAASVAETTWHEAGRWREARTEYDTRAHFGLLILDGALMRSTVVGERDGIELLGPGDVVRPWVNLGDDESSLVAPARWRVHQRVRLAHLDRRWASRMA